MNIKLDVITANRNFLVRVGDYVSIGLPKRRKVGLYVAMETDDFHIALVNVMTGRCYTRGVPNATGRGVRVEEFFTTGIYRFEDCQVCRVIRPDLVFVHTSGSDGPYHPSVARRMLLHFLRARHRYSRPDPSSDGSSAEPAVGVVTLRMVDIPNPFGPGSEELAPGYYRRDAWEAELYLGPDGLPWVLLRETERGIVYEGPHDETLINYILEELTK